MEAHCFLKFQFNLFCLASFSGICLFKGTFQRDGFDRPFLKETSRRVFRKIRLSPIEWEPFNSRAPSRTVIAHSALNGKMHSKTHSAMTAPLVLHHTRIYKWAVKKFGFNCQMRNETFLIVIYHSSLEKGAMNAARACKLRNGVKKTPQFLLFSMAKGGPSVQWISPQLSKLMA